MTDLPLATLERIIKKAGAERVSEDAKRKMQEVLESYALEMASKANQFAKHAKRKTITSDDISLAAKTSKK